MKSIRDEALAHMALKEKQRTEASASLLNANKREAVREQMKVCIDGISSSARQTLRFFTD